MPLDDLKRSTGHPRAGSKAYAQRVRREVALQASAHGGALHGTTDGARMHSLVLDHGAAHDTKERP